MITSIKADNIGIYTALFDEASDILRGFKQVRTYDKNKTYYYKDSSATDIDSMFVELTINNLEDFTTKFNEHEKTLYIKILNEDGEWVGITEGFNNPEYRISTLEEYFAHLADLGAINRKYTILPLDEDHFEINADTRAITIPANFKKNGIGIQGDDLAEVLYFKIDRYFDYMDLNNCDIFIQWETPKGPDGTVVKSASPAYIRDIESEPGKLIFGWILDDAITAHSGTLKFSVRFFQWNDKEAAIAGTERILAYSFSTLTASVTIHPSINFNPEKDEINLDDVGERLLERLENSEIVGGYSAAVPEFEKNLIAVELDYGTEKVNDDGDIIFDGTALRALAFAPDTGSISYLWKKQDLNDANSVEEQKITPLKNKNLAVKIDKTQPLKPYLVYYTNEALTEIYKGTEISAEDMADEDFNLYLRYASYEIPVDDGDNDLNDGQTGSYWVVATNRITNSSTPKESIKVTFPRPKDIVITTSPEPSGILNDGKCELSVSVEEATSTIQKKSYKWFHNGTAIEGSDSPIYVATKEGQYKVEITNKRNGAEKTAEPKLSTRVTLPAATPIYTTPAAKDFKVTNLSDTNCPYIILDPDVAADKYVVEWRFVEGDKDELIFKDVLIPGQDDELISTFNPKNYESIITDIAADDDIDGVYYAIVKNYLNCSNEELELPVGSVKATEIPASYHDMFTVNY